MGLIFVGLIVLSLSSFSWIFVFKANDQTQFIGRIILSLAISLGGIAAILAGIKEYYFQELINQLKKLNKEILECPESKQNE